MCIEEHIPWNTCSIRVRGNTEGAWQRVTYIVGEIPLSNFSAIGQKKWAPNISKGCHITASHRLIKSTQMWDKDRNKYVNSLEFWYM